MAIGPRCGCSFYGRTRTLDAPLLPIGGTQAAVRLKYDFQVEVTTRRGWGGGGRDLNATGATYGCNPRSRISEVRNSLVFAYDANVNRWPAPLL
jgi:hypothetical protein